MCVFDWKVMPIGYDYEVNLSTVIFYTVGMAKACLYAFKEGCKLRICVKKRGKSQNSEGWKFQGNRTEFTIKLVMIGPLENYKFLWGHSSVC